MVGEVAGQRTQLDRLEEDVDACLGGCRAYAVREAVRETAAQLGNTPAVCRASYVAPALIESYRGCGDPDAWLGGALRNGRASCPAAKLERILVAKLSKAAGRTRQ